MFISVLLPEPLAAHDGGIFAEPKLQVQRAKRVDFDIGARLAVDFGQILHHGDVLHAAMVDRLRGGKTDLPGA